MCFVFGWIFGLYIDSVSDFSVGYLWNDSIVRLVMSVFSNCVCGLCVRNDVMCV